MPWLWPRNRCLGVVIAGKLHRALFIATIEVPEGLENDTNSAVGFAYIT